MVILPKNCQSPSSKNSIFSDGDAVVEVPIPMGWRFMPTEEELIGSYLSRKVAFRPLPAQIIKEIDAIEFYSQHPKNLVGSVCFQRDPYSLKPEEYLFIHHDEYFHGRIEKTKPVGEDIGFWSSNGKEEEIYDSDGNVFACKIHFTFFTKATKARKTHWKMEEYRLLHSCNSNDHHQNLSRDEWVVARISGA